MVHQREQRHELQIQVPILEPGVGRSSDLPLVLITVMDLVIEVAHVVIRVILLHHLLQNDLCLLLRTTVVVAGGIGTTDLTRVAKGLATSRTGKALRG